MVSSKLQWMVSDDSVRWWLRLVVVLVVEVGGNGGVIEFQNDTNGD